MIPFKHLLKSIIQLVFPIECINCGAEQSWLCADCQAALPFNGKPLTSPPPLDLLLVATEYQHPVIETLIHLLKYQGVHGCATPLSDIVTDYMRRIDKKVLADILYRTQDTIIVPVPLHTKRQRDRGFNQSALLAQLVARQLKLPYRDDMLRRIRWTTPQATLTKAERELNLQGAFALRGSFKNPPKNVILIDDVATTASTLCGCAAVLKKHGVQQVIGLVVASDRDA